MNEYLIAYFTPPNKYGNAHIQAFSKKGALECFKVENEKSIVLNIIEL